MEERAVQILEATVREFIATGEPVSSGWLYDHYDFGIKPAMIRAELEGLSGEGFLEQPHRSSGRTPTDRGYEFFARQMLAHAHEGVLDSVCRKLQRLFLERDWPDLLQDFSAELGLLGVADDVGEHAVYKEGLEHLVDSFDWETPEEIKTIIRDWNEIDERLKRIRSKFVDGDNLRIFIGRRSPVTRSGELAVIAGNYRMDGERVVLLAIGPKRMDYKRTLKIFTHLSNE